MNLSEWIILAHNINKIQPCGGRCTCIIKAVTVTCWLCLRVLNSNFSFQFYLIANHAGGKNTQKQISQMNKSVIEETSGNSM